MPSDDPGSMYDTSYFDVSLSGSGDSADLLVPLILRLLGPASVIDVGCGRGAWAASFLKHGVDDVTGVDGTYVRQEELLIDPARFHAADLRHGLTMDRRYDLAVSLEVAEHLPPSSAEGFVASLTDLAPVVVFSAAVPGQRGDGHINEQWPGYWAALFESKGYGWCDVIRERVWNDDRVEWWYAQNIMIYIDRQRISDWPKLKHAFAPPGTRPRALAHPKMHEWGTEEIARLNRKLNRSRPWRLIKRKLRSG